MSDSDSERMQCMEVWGGNQAADRAVETPGLKTWVFSRPYRQSAGGGDVYYLSSCASGRITRILLADVSGHGERVSQIAIGLRELMRSNINYIRQTRFVRAMNQQFAELAQYGSFATALVSTFFAPTKTLTLCNAGHPPPLVLRHETGTWSELVLDRNSGKAISDTPLGVVDEAVYSRLDVRLNPGDMVLSYSDSVIESVDAHGQQLGLNGILELVQRTVVDDPGDLIPRLMDRITEFNSDNLHQDDTTVVLCQATGEATPMRNNFLAPFRLFRSPTDRTTIA